MKLNNNITRSLMTTLRRLPLAMAAILALAGGMKAESMKLHPAFDSAPVRIIDTEKRTYFHLFQKSHNSGLDTYKVPVAAPFIYLKDEPSRGIFPLSDLYALHGATVTAAEYSPEGGFLALLYSDGALDIIGDSGETKHNNVLLDSDRPGWAKINSMTLCGTQIWLATAGGYMVVDGLNGETLKRVSLGADVERAARCGSRTVIQSDGVLYDGGSREYPASLADLTPIPDGDAPGNPQIFLPCAGTSFIYIGDKLATGTYSLNAAIFSDGKWVRKHIKDLWLPEIGTDVMLMNTFEQNLVRNKEGWLLFTGGAVNQLSNSVRPDSPDFIRTLGTADTTGKAHQISLMGSWDMTGGWTYCDRGRFSPATLGDGCFLIDDSKAVRPSAPAVAHSTHLAYSPEYGTIGVSYGTSFLLNTMLQRLPPLLSTYKNGVWSLPGTEYNVPRSIAENPELFEIFSHNREIYPMANPVGMSLEPTDGRYIWLGSPFGGMAAMNLSDPGSEPLHFSAPSDPFSSFPNFKEIFRSSTRWGGYALCSTPVFDSDATLWTVHTDYDDQKEGNPAISLMYWPAAERRKVIASHDAGKASGIGTIKIPLTGNGTPNMKCYAFTHPSNRNKILLFTPEGGDKNFIRLNHNGTLADTSDDKVERFCFIEDQFGGRWDVRFCYALAEDPANGVLWLADFYTLFELDLSAEIKDGVIKGRVLDLTEGDYLGNPLCRIPTQGVCLDDAGRVWVTTEGSGVWGISADRKRVVAHYTTANSSLPTDIGYGLVWNPESRSLMVSTDEGYVEIWPDIDGAEGATSLSVVPREISPDWNGALTVRGVTLDAEVTVSGSDGALIASLKAGADGSAVWNLQGKDGRRVKSGIYTVRSGRNKAEVAIMR
ncbi:MAG: hypothetical protein K2J70_06175 [Muribaculaceae bacterium]|nr:hypothetical protein [Muribaculaceae bacterium]